MRSIPRSPCLVAILLLSATTCDAEPLRPYGHPGLDLQFSAPPGWREVARPGDAGTHERVDPETGIHVLMWATSTESGAERYLSKMCGMMDLEPGAEVRSRTIGGRAAHVVDVAGTIEGRAVHTVLAVIPSGRSRDHPFETVLAIVQVWCPRAAHASLARRMDDVLESVRLTDRMIHAGCPRPLYPETRETPPDLPTPLVAADGEQYVTVRTREGRHALVRVTVENGAPNDYDRGEWGKGRQLHVDAEDFPTLARTGLHAAEELDGAETITGRPVAAITADARPGRLSTAGFLAADEDLLTVIRRDDRLVAALDLTHPQLARPLFQVFNLILRDMEVHHRGDAPLHAIETVLYAGREIRIDADGGKGWQASIFDDEVRGYWDIRIRREPTYGEMLYLRGRYGRLGEEGLAALAGRLTSIRFSEMVPFYIQRYGFYEGHTAWRADPLAVALVFGLAGIEKLDAAAGGDLPGWLAGGNATE